MNILNIRLVFIAFLASTYILAQELPPIQKYSPKDYNGENQNWAISQSPEKLIYVANNKGLLEFNGAKWQLYPSPNETVMRSVQVVDDRIYTGCIMEFGYWEKNNSGILDYTSISKKMNIDLLEDEQFWNILNIDEWIVFQSLKRIYTYNAKDKSANIINTKGTINKIFKVDKHIYFQRQGKGIYKIVRGKVFLVFDDEVVKNNSVVNIFKNDKELLILTKDNGFYRSRNNSLVKWNIESNKLLSKVTVFNGIRLKDNSFAIGTISHGIIYLNEKGNLLYHINQNNILSNNTVLSLFEDAANNIWLGLDNGISYININAPYRLYHDKEGILGSTYTSVINNGKLYLGTNQGLFYKNIKSNDNFQFIKGTQGQVWCLKVINRTLLCGHDSGTYIVEGNQVKKILNTYGTWNIAPIEGKPSLLLQGNYDGLYVLEKLNNTWKLKHKIDGFNNSSQYFETLGNEIFVNHSYNGVFKVEVDSTFSKVKNISVDTIIKGSNSGIIKYNENILYAYKEGIFKYNRINNKFIKDTLLSKVYNEDEYISGKLRIDKKNNLWVFSNSNMSYITQGKLSNTPKIKNIPLTKEVRNDIFGYENIMKFEDENKYLFGTTFGYLTVDIDKFEIEDFNVYIGRVINGSQKNNKTVKNILNKTLKGDFKNDENNVEISYFTPEYYTYLNPQYQYQLIGIYDDWVNWSENSIALFENLPFGDYTFNVRAKIGDKITKNIDSYSFKIEKPFYISNIMIATYFLLLSLILLFIHNVYKQFYKKQQEKQFALMNRKMEMAKVQNEKEVIKIRNEKLQSEYKSKAKELAASAMSVVKMNELLKTIKDKLSSIQNKKLINPVIDIIDKNLNHNDDWEFFQEAFSNADSDFLRKLKTLHPNLSPSDLKLCAYLRLNLSSKELAQVQNISIKSVEVKRYRLRKRLKLARKVNLVNYILEL